MLPLPHACVDEDEPTPAREASRSVKPNSPLKQDLDLDAPGDAALTTRLVFSGEPGNARARIFDETLLTTISTAGDSQIARLDFML